MKRRRIGLAPRSIDSHKAEWRGTDVLELVGELEVNLWLLSTRVKERNCISVYEGREPLVFKAYGLRCSRLIMDGLLALHNECGEHEKEGKIRGQEDWGGGGWRWNIPLISKIYILVLGGRDNESAQG